MPSFGNIIREAVEAIKSPAIPEAAARGTAEHPKILDPALIKPSTTVRAPEIPFKGSPEPAVMKATRATEVKDVTTSERIQNLKTQIGGLIRRDPNLPKDIQEKLYEGSWRANAADDVADLDIAQWFSPLKSSPAEQATLINDYMITADEVAQALRYGKDKIRDVHIDVWKNSLDRLQGAVDSDPEVVESLARIRAGLDEQFDDMAARNWIDKTRYLDDYTPIRRINAVMEGLATFYGEQPDALKSRLLDAQRKRTGGQGARETDLLNVFRATRSEYLRKIAEHETFLDFIADPTLNVTDKFSNGQEIPRNLAVFRPGAGAFGSTVKAKEGYYLDGALKSIDPKGYINTGGWVFPRPLVEAMSHFSKPKHTSQENAWYRMGSALSKNLTVYNPANTNVNRVSDLLVAMFTPGEASAQPVGVLKWYGKAAKASYKGAYGKGKTIINLHGKDVDVWDLAIREGLTSGTVAHDVGMENPLPPELLRLHPEAEAAHSNWWANTVRNLEADRLATEASPRIAAGLEAVERTGDWSQFGRVGRDVTFRYGAGAPRASQFPALRLISPFLQFQGLATARILDMAASKNLGTKGRLALSLIAVPLSFHMWNQQNDEYVQVENALPEYERNQLHIIVPDPLNPAKVRKGVDGQPVILRFRYWVPEQVASTIGLGNLPARVDRVLKGRDTPMQFMEQTGSSAAESISNQLVIPALVSEALTGKNQQGRPMTGLDRLLRTVPGTRIVANAAESNENYGPEEAAKVAAYEAAGLRFARPRHVDAKLLDAQLQDAIREMKEAKAAFVGAARNKTGTDTIEARDVLEKKIQEVKRLKKQIKSEKDAGYNPPPTDKNATAKRKASVQKSLKEDE